MRIAPATLLALLLAPSIARADRIAVVPLEAPGRPAPVIEGDRLAADLLQKGHRVIAGADALARLSSGEAEAGPDWGARTIQAIGMARAALARLDRAFALSTARRVRGDLVRRGGGAAGSEVLVEWCLLERQLALAASDPRGASGWLDAAVAVGPDVELDPLRHPDEERDLFLRRRKKLRSEVAATLSVATTPASADVWVDGVRRCSSPCSVALVAGRHLVLVSSPAHAPAVFDAEIGPGASVSRQLGLTAAYAGASARSVSSILADPSRRAEGASALEPMARFLDVEHVVALVPDRDEVRILVAPPAAGRSRTGPAVPADSLSGAVLEQLRPLETPPARGATAWYAKPGTWLAGAAVVAVVVGGALIYGASRPPTTGSLTVSSP